MLPFRSRFDNKRSARHQTLDGLKELDVGGRQRKRYQTFSLFVLKFEYLFAAVGFEIQWNSRFITRKWAIAEIQTAYAFEMSVWLDLSWQALLAHIPLLTWAYHILLWSTAILLNRFRNRQFTNQQRWLPRLRDFLKIDNRKTFALPFKRLARLQLLVHLKLVKCVHSFLQIWFLLLHYAAHVDHLNGLGM
jgi:hypothetical protein